QTGDGLSGDSGDATKAFVDARITITPDDTNEVGQEHTFTVTLLKDLGDGNGLVAAANESVTVTLTGANGAKPGIHGQGTAPAAAAPSLITLTTDINGQAKVTFTSATSGKVFGDAKATLSLDPDGPGAGSLPAISVTRQTGDGLSGDSGDATKAFVDARISIAPDDTNEVGQSHTFTVTLLKDLGDGNGLVAAAGESVPVTLDGTLGAVPDINGPGVAPAAADPSSIVVTTGLDGKASVSLPAAPTVKVFGDAKATLSLDPDGPGAGSLPAISVTRQTGDGLSGDSGDATKAFVDARISIAPDDTNGI